MQTERRPANTAARRGEIRWLTARQARVSKSTAKGETSAAAAGEQGWVTAWRAAPVTVPAAWVETGLETAVFLTRRPAEIAAHLVAAADSAEVPPSRAAAGDLQVGVVVAVAVAGAGAEAVEAAGVSRTLRGENT